MEVIAIRAGKIKHCTWRQVILESTKSNGPNAWGQLQGAMAPAAGIEPTLSVLETDALPLHHAGMTLVF